MELRGYRVSSTFNASCFFLLLLCLFYTSFSKCIHINCYSADTIYMYIIQNVILGNVSDIESFFKMENDLSKFFSCFFLLQIFESLHIHTHISNSLVNTKRPIYIQWMCVIVSTFFFFLFRFCLFFVVVYDDNIAFRSFQQTNFSLLAG